MGGLIVLMMVVELKGVGTVYGMGTTGMETETITTGAVVGFEAEVEIVRVVG